MCKGKSEEDAGSDPPEAPGAMGVEVLKAGRQGKTWTAGHRPCRWKSPVQAGARRVHGGAASPGLPVTSVAFALRVLHLGDLLHPSQAGMADHPGSQQSSQAGAFPARASGVWRELS
jgi:hypothetical protein